MTYVCTIGVNFRDSDQCDQAMRRDVVKCSQRKGNISHLIFQAKREEDGKAEGPSGSQRAALARFFGCSLWPELVCPLPVTVSSSTHGLK